MNVNFYLKDSKAVNTTAIYAQVTWQQKRLRYYIDLSISPDEWNPKTGKPRKGANDVGKVLDTKKAKIKELFNQYHADNGREPTPETLRALLDEEFKGKMDSRTDTLFGFFADAIKRMEDGRLLLQNPARPYAFTTIQVYKQTLEHLKAFAKDTGNRVDFDTITVDMHGQLIDYLHTERTMLVRGKERVMPPMTANAVGKVVKTLKAVMNLALNRKVTTSIEHTMKGFFVPQQDSSYAIALTEDELQEMKDLQLRPGLERARDLFILGCRTALRFSDLVRLSIKDVNDRGFISITVIKGRKRETVLLPVHEDTRRILEKYGKPIKISNPGFNLNLKAIAALMPSMQDDVLIELTRGGQQVFKTVKKAELLTVHTARRTMLTNGKKDGIDNYTLMQISGHKSEKTFYKYIRWKEEDPAERIQRMWNSKLKAI